MLEVPKEDKEEEDPKSPRESKRRSSTLKLDRAVSKANLSEFFKAPWPFCLMVYPGFI